MSSAHRRRLPVRSCSYVRSVPSKASGRRPSWTVCSARLQASFRSQTTPRCSWIGSMCGSRQPVSTPVSRRATRISAARASSRSRAFRLWFKGAKSAHHISDALCAVEMSDQFEHLRCCAERGVNAITLSDEAPISLADCSSAHCRARPPGQANWRDANRIRIPGHLLDQHGEHADGNRSSHRFSGWPGAHRVTSPYALLERERTTLAQHRCRR